VTSSPTGDQLHLRREVDGRVVEAVVTSVAAGLRSLTVDGRVLTETFPDTVVPPSACGITLFPWPNRVDGGRWSLDGEAQQLDITEPSKGNASHGLLRYTSYRLVERDEHAVTQAATVYPQHGWPLQLDLTVRHELVADGLRVSYEVENVGARPAPFAVGAHPFLRVGDVDVADLTVSLDAATRFVVDERGVPTGTEPVEGTAYDLRGAPVVGDLDLDTPYRDVAPGDDGVRRARLTAPDGTATELWQDASFGYVQVFTPRNFPRDGVLGLAVAAEPMTAPPNALATGEGLLRLEPGERWSGSWGIRHVAG
jgi:aldose 1-epimerase